MMINRPITTNDRAWRAKANKVVGDLCLGSYLQANQYKDGSFRKRHAQYHVPQLAEDLIRCLNHNDELTAKAIFIKLAISPEFANDPENR